MTSGPIGIIANPSAGKDIRRLIAHASVFDNNEKRSIVRRAVLGAVAAGGHEFLYLPDPYQIVEGIFEQLDADAAFTAVATSYTQTAADTTEAARAMCEAGCAVVLTLGGDGTNRAFARGWLNAPVIPVSTGTNNVFPQVLEGTVAGAAAGLIASGRVALDEVAKQSKRIRVEIEDAGEELALVDVASLADRFVAARAVWMPSTFRTMVFSRAEPAAIGLSSIGGLLHPVGADEDAGLLVEAGPGGSPLLAPIAPGLYAHVPIREVRSLALAETVSVSGPCVLAFDGERELNLRPGQAATISVVRDGLRVVDVQRTLRLAADRGLFRTPD